MKKKTRMPSFSKIIVTDYPAFLASLAPIFLFLIYIILLIVQRNLVRPLLPQVMEAIVYLLLGLTLLALLFMFYRAWLIQRVFRRGSDVQGKVTTLELRRLGGRVGYTYSFGQKRLTSGAALRSSPQTKKIRKGDRVLVVVDRDNPKQAFLRDLYR